jgi:hypothetical protein
MRRLDILNQTFAKELKKKEVNILASLLADTSAGPAI